MTYRDAVRCAFRKGYRVSASGEVISPFSGRELTLAVGTSGYLCFSFRDDGGVRHKLAVHKLAGYQKFGEQSLEDGEWKNISACSVAW